MSAPRESGWYWFRCADQWDVAFFTGAKWFLAGLANPAKILDDQIGPRIEPPTEATSRGLNAPTRSKCEAALDVAREALRIIALPAGEEAGMESPLERRMRLAAQVALDRIAALMPECGR